jgi:hypothetical protein
MAELVLLNPKQYVAGLDLSGSYSQHALVLDADAPEFTAFGDTTREYKGGLIGAGSEHQGFWDSPIDTDLFTNMAAAARNTTITPDGGDEGDVAFFFSQLTTSYSPGANIGDAYTFSNSNQVSGVVTRGLIAVNGTEVATDDGTAFNLGAVAAGQKLRASLHVLAVAGSSPEVDVIIESDTLEAFTDDPTTEITFAQLTAVGGEYATADGAITGPWFRASWTLGGDTDSALIVVSVGIA